MRVVQLNEFINLPCGHAYQYLAEHEEAGVYIRDTQYAESDGKTILTLAPAQSSVPMVNDWVRTSFMGTTALSSGCISSDRTEASMDDALSPSTQRDAMYRKEDAEFLIYTDADMIHSIGIQLVGLRKLMGHAALGNDDEWEIRWESFIGHITWRISTNSDEFCDHESNAVAHRWRRLGYWATQKGLEMTVETIKDIAAHLSFSTHHLEKPISLPIGVDHTDRLDAILTKYEIPEIPRPLEELTSLYRSSPR